MATKHMIVITGFDKNLASIKELRQNLQMVYRGRKDVTIGVAAYGKDTKEFKPQTKQIQAYCKKQNIPHVVCLDSSVPIGTNIRGHSVLGAMDISHWFYQKGYQHVYILHDDMVIFRDFLPIYEKKMRGNWSFISQLCQTNNMFQARSNCFDKLKEIKHKKISSSRLHTASIRIRDVLLTFNKTLIQRLYNLFAQKEITKKEFFSSIHLSGDIGLFDLINTDLVRQTWRMKEQLLYGIGFDARKGNYPTKNKLTHIYENEQIIYAHGRNTISFFRKHLPEILNTIQKNLTDFRPNKIFWHMKDIKQNFDDGNVLSPISCSLHLTPEKQDENETYFSVDRFKELLSELKSLNCFSLLFTGSGEPLKHPDFSHFIKLASEEKFKLGLETNGVLLNEIEDSLQKFAFIQINMLAPNQLIYRRMTDERGFSKIKTNMIKYRKDIQILGASFTVSDKNKGYVHDIDKFGRALKLDYVQIQPHIDSDGNVFHYDYFGDYHSIPILKPQTNLCCKLARLKCTILPNGNVPFCNSTQRKIEKCVGNVYETTLQDILTHREEKQPDYTKCSYCPFATYEKAYFTYLKMFNVSQHFPNFL